MDSTGKQMARTRSPREAATEEFLQIKPYAWGLYSPSNRGHCERLNAGPSPEEKTEGPLPRRASKKH